MNKTKNTQSQWQSWRNQGARGSGVGKYELFQAEGSERVSQVSRHLNKDQDEQIKPALFVSVETHST